MDLQTTSQIAYYGSFPEIKWQNAGSQQPVLRCAFLLAANVTVVGYDGGVSMVLQDVAPAVHHSQHARSSIHCRRRLQVVGVHSKIIDNLRRLLLLMMTIGIGMIMMKIQLYPLKFSWKFSRMYATTTTFTTLTLIPLKSVRLKACKIKAKCQMRMCVVYECRGAFYVKVKEYRREKHGQTLLNLSRDSE